MSEVVTAEQIRALCQEFGYPEPGPNTIAAAQDNKLSEHELRHRFILLGWIDAGGTLDEAAMGDFSTAAFEAAYERAKIDPRRYLPPVEWKPGEDHIWMDERYWWHNDHPLDPEQECCSKALKDLYARFPDAP